ncbi:MAG: RNA polymerase sigma factor [Flavobacteriales bacterium]
MALSHNIKDQVLVQDYINGDEKALQKLLTRHKSAIYNFIYSKIHNRELAEDIFQDTFIKVIHNLKLKKYNEKGKFLPWVMRIAHNLVIDYFRKNNRFRKVEFKNSEDDDFDIFKILDNREDSIETIIIKDQILNDLNNILVYLPEDQQEIIRLRFYMGLSFKEISEDTNVSINTALGRMRYALINLRKIINEKNITLLES